MAEMHLKQSGFTYGVCRPFPKSKERLHKQNKTGDSKDIYQNQPDKACFQRDTACGNFKEINRRTAFDTILHD